MTGFYYLEVYAWLVVAWLVGGPGNTMPSSEETNCSLTSKFGSTVKPVLSDHSQRPKMGFQYQLSLNAGQKYCRMLQGEHSAILSTCIGAFCNTFDLH